MTLRIPDRRFLSTPSARRATIALCHFVFSLGISIHALREEGDFSDVVKQRVNFFISIHALREEGDQSQADSLRASRNFYPRPPRGGRRTLEGVHGREQDFYPRPPRGGRPIREPLKTCEKQISIHALREEGDRYAPSRRCLCDTFLSTPSARRATCSA